MYRRVCTDALAVLAAGVLDVLKAAVNGMRIMLSSAEEVQDAVSGMYAILQRHGGYIAEEAGPKGHAAIAAAAEAMLLLLQVLITQRQMFENLTLLAVQLTAKKGALCT